MSTISNLTTTDAPTWNGAENHGPLVSVLTWFLVITAFFAVFARVATRFAVVRQLRWDDATILVAMLLSIAHSVTTSLQVTNGLGQHIDTVSIEKLTRFQKDTFASEFIYIGVVSAIKISICLYLNSLTPVRLHRTIILALGVFTSIWMITSFLVLGFQCHVPHTWQILGGKCIDITAFWTYWHILNILTDLALIVMPWIILSNLQVEPRKKRIIIGCFSSRIIVVAITIIQIYYLQTETSNTHDMTFDLWPVSLLGEFVITISLVTACIPYLKPFMESLESGVLHAGSGAVARGHGFGYGDRSDSRSRKYGPLSNLSAKPSRTHLGGVRMDNLGYAGEKDAFGRQTATVSAKGHGGDSDDDSQTSQSKIIRKTVGWSVTEEPQISPPPSALLEYPTRSDYARAV